MYEEATKVLGDEEVLQYVTSGNAIAVTRCTVSADLIRQLIDGRKEMGAALTKIRTAGYNWGATSQWMQKVAASALEPGKWPDAGEQPRIQEPADHG
jgi:hypothetical protein